MKNEKWKTTNKHWKMKHEKWRVKNEHWKMKRDKWKVQGAMAVTKKNYIAITTYKCDNCCIRYWSVGTFISSAENNLNVFFNKVGTATV